MIERQDWYNLRLTPNNMQNLADMAYEAAINSTSTNTVVDYTNATIVSDYSSIQEAKEVCISEGGHRILRFTPGVYNIDTVYGDDGLPMQSTVLQFKDVDGLTIVIDRGAVIQVNDVVNDLTETKEWINKAEWDNYKNSAPYSSFSTYAKYTDYILKKNTPRCAVFHFINCANIELCGGGAIKGRFTADHWQQNAQLPVDSKNTDSFTGRHGDRLHNYTYSDWLSHPCAIRCEGCSNVKINNIEISNLYSRGIIISGLKWTEAEVKSRFPEGYMTNYGRTVKDAMGDDILVSPLASNSYIKKLSTNVQITNVTVEHVLAEPFILSGVENAYISNMKMLNLGSKLSYGFDFESGLYFGPAGPAKMTDSTAEYIAPLPANRNIKVVDCYVKNGGIKTNAMTYSITVGRGTEDVSFTRVTAVDANTFTEGYPHGETAEKNLVAEGSTNYYPRKVNNRFVCTARYLVDYWYGAVYRPRRVTYTDCDIYGQMRIRNDVVVSGGRSSRIGIQANQVNTLEPIEDAFRLENIDENTDWDTAFGCSLDSLSKLCMTNTDELPLTNLSAYMGFNADHTSYSLCRFSSTVLSKVTALSNGIRIHPAQSYTLTYHYQDGDWRLPNFTDENNKAQTVSNTITADDTIDIVCDSTQLWKVLLNKKVDGTTTTYRVYSKNIGGNVSQFRFENEGKATEVVFAVSDTTVDNTYSMPSQKKAVLITEVHTDVSSNTFRLLNLPYQGKFSYTSTEDTTPPRIENNEITCNEGDVAIDICYASSNTSVVFDNCKFKSGNSLFISANNKEFNEIHIRNSDIELNHPYITGLPTSVAQHTVKLYIDNCRIKTTYNGDEELQGKEYCVICPRTDLSIRNSTIDLTSLKSDLSNGHFIMPPRKTDNAGIHPNIELTNNEIITTPNLYTQSNNKYDVATINQSIISLRDEPYTGRVVILDNYAPHIQSALSYNIDESELIGPGGYLQEARNILDSE